MQSASPKDSGRELELLLYVVNDFAAVEAQRPVVYLVGHTLSDLQEYRVAGDSELKVALVIQRHGFNLTECVLAVEHPTVGSRE